MGEAFTTTALRELSHLYPGHPCADFCRMAADHIDRLTSEIEGLRKRHLFETDLAGWQKKAVTELYRAARRGDAADVCSIPESAFAEPWTKAAGMGWKHESIGDYELSGPRDCQSGAAERMAESVDADGPDRGPACRYCEAFQDEPHKPECPTREWTGDAIAKRAAERMAHAAIDTVGMVRAGVCLSCGMPRGRDGKSLHLPDCPQADAERTAHDATICVICGGDGTMDHSACARGMAHKQSSAPLFQVPKGCSPEAGDYFAHAAAERMAHMPADPQRTAHAIDTSTDHLRAEFLKRAEKAQRTMADLYGPAYALDLARFGNRVK